MQYPATQLPATRSAKDSSSCVRGCPLRVLTSLSIRLFIKGERMAWSCQYRYSEATRSALTLRTTYHVAIQAVRGTGVIHTGILISVKSYLRRLFRKSDSMIDTEPVRGISTTYHVLNTLSIFRCSRTQQLHKSTSSKSWHQPILSISSHVSTNILVFAKILRLSPRSRTDSVYERQLNYYDMIGGSSH